MKTMKKSFSFLVAVFAFCMVFAVTAKVDAAEVTSQLNIMDRTLTEKVTVMDVPVNNFDVYELTNDRNQVRITVNYAYEDETLYNQVGLFDTNGVLLDTFTIQSGYNKAAFNNLQKNKIYYYTVRTVKANYDTRQFDAVSNWAPQKAFTTATFTVKKIGKAKGFSIKVPKIKGIKSYKIYISKKSSSGYKKIKTLKPGKKVNVKNYKGKAFKVWQIYYVRVVPISQQGSIKCFSTIYNTYDFTYLIKRVYR